MAWSTLRYRSAWSSARCSASKSSNSDNRFGYSRRCRAESDRSKQDQTGDLRLIAATKSFGYVKPGIFPFKVRPATLPVLCRLYGLPSFVGSTRGEEAPRYISGDFRRLPGKFIVLRDEGVNVARASADFLQSQSNGAHARTLG